MPGLTEFFFKTNYGYAGKLTILRIVQTGPKFFVSFLNSIDNTVTKIYSLAWVKVLFAIS